MKKLKDFENELNKCSKCGLCQQACPIYQKTGNECAVSKGKFIMLSGVIKGDLPLNQDINKYLETCTKCNKCSNFCPAGINVCQIFQTAKYEYQKEKFSFKILKFIQSPLIFDNIIKVGKLFGNIYREKQHQSKNAEVLYFKGCVNEIIPKCENALKKIFKKANITLSETNFTCCGQPFFSSGNLERYENVKEKNTNLINTSSAKYILTDCASCESTLKSYGTITKEFINAETLITQTDLIFHYKKPIKVAYHKPCHMGNTDFIEKLKKQCINIEFTQIPETCCGLAGEFFLKNTKLSNEIAKQRTEEILSSGAEIILTSCPACEIGLKKALLGTKIKVYNIIEFLSKANKIVT